MEQKFTVTGMTCAACSARVEKVTRELGGVERADVNLLNGNMTVLFDENMVSSQDIIAAVVKAGYGAEKAQADMHSRRNAAQERALAQMKNRILLSAILLIPLIYLSMGHMAGLPAGPLAKTENSFLFAMVQLLLVIPICIVNRTYYQKGFQNLVHGAPNMDSLIAVGSAAALIYSVAVTMKILTSLVNGNPQAAVQLRHSLYYESAGMILTLVTLGKYMETRSKGKTGQAVEKLMDLSPKTAIVLRDGREFEISAEEVSTGDILVVKPGARIAADGTVTEGYSSVDESALTGESIPVEKKPGDRVSAATINRNGSFLFQVDKVGEDTTLAQIIHLVEDAGGSKAPIARTADRIAGVFVPIVMAVALAAAVVWLIAGKDLEFALSIGVSVLVIACPCALGLATPVAIMVGTGRGAEEGILYKSAESLENLNSVNSFVLDKTGTITEGKPVITDVLPQSGDRRSLLQLAGSLETRSEHPLAEAVTGKAREEGIIVQEPQTFEAIAGKGIRAELNGKRYLAGSLRFLKESGIEVPERTDLAHEGKTPLYFAEEDGVFIGVIAAADMEKSDAANAVRELQKRGKDVILLTGDNEATAKAVADRIGIQNVVAGVLPQEKEQTIRSVQCQGKKVAMVGDGINDAPALMRSDVGIAIGAGTDIALESADLVLMHSKPSDIVRALDLSAAVLRNIRQNLFWALFYNSLGIPIAAGALYPALGLKLSPVIGAAAMSLSSVFVVSNALRLRFYKSPYDRDLENNKKRDILDLEKDGAKEPNKNLTEDNAMETVLKVSGMMCVHCKEHVEKALLSVEGVQSAEADLESGIAKINGDCSRETLIAAVKEAGYEAE